MEKCDIVICHNDVYNRNHIIQKMVILCKNNQRKPNNQNKMTEMNPLFHDEEGVLS